MVSKVIRTVLDDIDGSEDAETITFSFNGSNYEIDLSSKNVDKFEKALEPYVSAGRKVGRGGSAKAKPASSVDLNAVRAWAAENGIEVAPRGRVAASVIEQYEAANK